MAFFDAYGSSLGIGLFYVTDHERKSGKIKIYHIEGYDPNNGKGRFMVEESSGEQHEITPAEARKFYLLSPAAVDTLISQCIISREWLTRIEEKPRKEPMRETPKKAEPKKELELLVA